MHFVSVEHITFRGSVNTEFGLLLTCCKLKLFLIDV